MGPNTLHLALLLLALLASLFSQVLSSGVFELNLLEFKNNQGINNDGNCCTGIREGGICLDTCKTFFRICLNHYQATISPDPKCTFGEVTTPVIGQNTFTFPDNVQTFSNPIRLPFDFTWPGTFTLIIEAWHNQIPEQPSNDSPRELISRMSVQRSLAVADQWSLFDFHDKASELSYQYRVVCDSHYYGPGCRDLCKPRDDQFGHYVCSENGTVVCLEGWTGQYCDQAICLEGCHDEHGHCEEPYECRCRMGWQGRLCDQCIPYPGCQYGSCNKAWECSCDEGWGGLFCNQDLNYCTHHHPCKNGATCTNTGEGSYTCECPRGFTGTNCEIEIDDCLYQPCRNNGTCTDIGHGYQCQCPAGFRGRHCESSATSCHENPCKNDATCIPTTSGYHCQCKPGFTGINCEAEMYECSSGPCMNGGRCIDENNGYRCVCRPGFRGAQCEEDNNDCSLNPCLNGGSCVDLVNDFKCRCVAGFVGPLCQTNVDDCLNWPCANGGTCHDLVNDFSCVCAPGFIGKDCRVNINECLPNPCRNGGTCTDEVNDYGCTCPPGYFGKDCERSNSVVVPPPPQSSPPAGDGYSTTQPAGGNFGTSAPATIRDESVITMQQLLLIICLGVGIPILVILAIILYILFVRRKHTPQDSTQKENVHNERKNINNKLNSIEGNIHNAIPPSNNMCLKVTNEEQEVSKKTCNTTTKHHNLMDKSMSNLKDYKKDTLTKNTKAANEVLYDRDLNNASLSTSSTASTSNKIHRDYIKKPTLGHESRSDSSVVDISEYTSGDVHIVKPVNKDHAAPSRGSIFILDKPHVGSHHHPSVAYTEGMLATEV